jgi:outer membrane lipoprotein SlyB
MRTFALLGLMLLAAGCSSDPIVDMKGVDQERYRQDLAECRQYVDQVDTARSAGGGALLGAAGGAAVGAVIGAITGSPGTGAAVGAGGGGTSGLFAGGASGERKKERIVRNCLRERGYPVLD